MTEGTRYEASTARCPNVATGRRTGPGTSAPGALPIRRANAPGDETALPIAASTSRGRKSTAGAIRLMTASSCAANNYLQIIR